MIKLFESIMLIEQTVKYVKDKIHEYVRSKGEATTPVHSDIIELILDADPSLSHGYTDGDKQDYQMWIFNLLSKMGLEKDWYDIKEDEEFWKRLKLDLKYHHMYKKEMDINDRDIGTVKSFSELQNVLEKYPWYDPNVYPLSKREMEKQIKDREIDKLETTDWYIIIPHTKEQQIKYGWGTEWCTQYTKAENRFDEYQEQFLYIIINKNNPEEKYQLYFFDHGQFTDSSDIPINIQEFLEKNPEIGHKITKYVLYYDEGELETYSNIGDEYIDYNAIESVTMTGVELLQKCYFKIEQNPLESDIIKFINIDRNQVPHIINSLIEKNIDISEKIQLLQIKKYPSIIETFLKQNFPISDNVILTQIKGNGNIIKFIPDPSEEMQLWQVSSEPHSIMHIKDPSEEVQLQQIWRDADVFTYIENPSERVKAEQVKGNGYIIRYIKNPSEELQEYQVRNVPDSIRFIQDPSEYIQEIQIDIKPETIKYIKHPTKKVQFLQVEYDPNLIKHIHNPSEEIQLKQIEKNPKVIKYLRDYATEKAQLQQIKRDQSLIYFISRPSEDIQLQQVEQHPNAIRYIKNPTDKVKEVVGISEAQVLMKIKN